MIAAEDATPHPSSSYLLVDLILVKPSSEWAAADGSSSVPGDCRAPRSHRTLCPVVPADLELPELGLACNFRRIGIWCCPRFRAVISECVPVEGSEKGGAKLRLGRWNG